jgi:heterodisulfide reductase subunit A
VDEEKCIACGLCAEKCPAKTADEFQEGLSKRKAIYLPYPQAVPLKYVIDQERCIYFKKGKCKACEKYCPTGAIVLDDQERVRSLQAGSVLLTSGMQTFDPSRHDTYQYSHFKNVVTSIEFERILAAGGPTSGHVSRISDHEPAKRIAWLQCIGSRDINTCDNGYCSAVCCMYAIKEAVIAKEHIGQDCQAAIFFMDMRTYGKDFEKYYTKAAEEGVRFLRSRVHSITENPDSSLHLEYVDHDGARVVEDFDLVVLSVGMEPADSAVETARRLNIQLNPANFIQTDDFSPVSTSTPGIYVAGVIQGCKDIPQSVMEASAAACNAGVDLAEARGSLVQEKTFPQEKDVSSEAVRIGVFVCNCGSNIGGIADVPAIAEYAKSLPGVAYVEENQFSCSQDTQEKMAQTVKENSLNRVVVAACTPRTHEPLFQETIRSSGLNPYLFEMANIRNQCTWVHSKEPEQATEKAKDLVRMAVARAGLLQPLQRPSIGVNQDALVLGGGITGMTAALGLADQGFKTSLVEKASVLGGNAARLLKTWQGSDIQENLAAMVERVGQHPNIDVYTDTEIADSSGFVGNFETRLSSNGRETTIRHGAVLLAVGAREHQPQEYLYGQDDRVMTHLDFDTAFKADDPRVSKATSAVFIQCVGSREPERPYCSKVCCTHSIKSALALKESEPDRQVVVLYRDIRTYGEREALYTEARRKGVLFIRFSLDSKPRVERDDSGLTVTVTDHVLDQDIAISTDLLVLASAIVPGNNDELAQMFKISQNEDKFFMEAHPKLRPVEFATDGIFLAGLAHYPKPIEESIAQAKAAAAKAASVLSKREITVEGAVSNVNESLCRACGACVEACPFNAIEVRDIDQEGRQSAYVQAALCKGCGSCAVACPTGAASVYHFEDTKVLSMVEEALADHG